MAKAVAGKPPEVLALAGRRIDAEGADPARFPLSQVEAVRRRLNSLMVEQQIGAVVCSAACGDDLVALEEAGRLGVRRRVVLPFAKERFRETSVVDRPGDWGEVYDRVIADVEASGDLVELAPGAGDENDSYRAANEAIIKEAETIAGPGERIAAVVWEGAPRSKSDATRRFSGVGGGSWFLATRHSDPIVARRKRRQTPMCGARQPPCCNPLPTRARQR